MGPESLNLLYVNIILFLFGSFGLWLLVFSLGKMFLFILLFFLIYFGDSIRILP